MREISRQEGVNREGNVSKRRKYLSPSNKSVKTVAEEFLEKASRELLGDNKSSVKGPFKLQDSDEDDDMSAEPIMSGYIKVSVISCIPAVCSVWIRVLVGIHSVRYKSSVCRIHLVPLKCAAQHPNVQDILKIASIMFSQFWYWFLFSVQDPFLSGLSINNLLVKARLISTLRPL
ncbi:hypothetical protein Tco_0289853 [Tanacetum coccineum]